MHTTPFPSNGDSPHVQRVRLYRHRNGGVFIHLGDLKKLVQRDELIAEAATMLYVAHEKGDSHAEGLRRFVAYLLGIACGQIPSDPALVSPDTLARLTFAPNQQPKPTPDNAKDPTAPSDPGHRNDGNEPGN